MLKINDLARHYAAFAADVEAPMQALMRSGWYVLGENVAQFEREFAAYCGIEHCLGVANGTDALELSLRAFDIGPGDEVVAVANAGLYAAIAIASVGATPVFADVDDATLLMSPDSLRQAIGPKTKAVIVTHLYGRLADVDALRAVAGNVPIVEDCAQSHGARDARGRRAGSFGNVACYSFYPTKNLGALGDGGALATNDAGIAAKLRALRQYGWTSKYRSEVAGGRNSRLDEMQALVLRATLPRLDGWNARRLEIARRFERGIRDPSIRLRPFGDGDVAHLFVVECAGRESLKAHLAQAGFMADVHYPIPDHHQPAFAGRARVAGSLAATEHACAHVLTLPCFPEMTDAECDAIVDACNAWAGGR